MLHIEKYFNKIEFSKNKQKNGENEEIYIETTSKGGNSQGFI